jgi:hypothetical protein
MKLINPGHKVLILVIILLSTSSILMAEELSPPLKKRIPIKAAGLSILLPGAGQVYNNQYIKAGIVVALEGLCAGYAIYHDEQADDYLKAYKKSQSALDYALYTDFYDKKQSDLFWLGTVIFLSSLDAFVDAHLHNFDDNKSKVRIKFDNNSLQLSFRF